MAIRRFKTSSIAQGLPKGSKFWDQVDHFAANWIVVGDSGAMAWATDPTSDWTATTSSFGSTNINDILWDGSKWIAVGNSGTVATSTNGKDWTQGTTLSGTLSEIAKLSSSSTYVIGGNGVLYTSSNGTTWTSRTSQGEIYGLFAGDTLFVLNPNSSSTFTSSDGITWTSRYTNQVGFGGHWNGSIYVVHANYGETYTSSNGTTWTARSSKAFVAYSGAYGGTSNRHVAVGNSRSIAYTTDATSTWTDTGNVWSTVSWAEKVAGTSTMFASAHRNNQIATSPDGATWTIRTPPSGAWNSIATKL